MSTWKNPRRLVWHSVVCSRCHRVISRLKLPGLLQERTERLCNQCASTGAARPAARGPAPRPAREPAPRPARERRRGPRRPEGGDAEPT